jgi:cellulose synthase/poly-beta-1,6-N-acetylglucosamine synthase-like glycosyltransferase
VNPQVELSHDCRVSVLIPAWEEASGLAQTLERLNLVHYASWELILIAGGKDDTFEIAQRLIKDFTASPIQLIQQMPNGKNAALNRGLQAASGSIIVILDADSLVKPDWLKALLKPLANGSDAACGNYFPKAETWVSEMEQLEKIVTYQIQQRVILQGSGSIVIKRDVLEAVGGFPEDVKVGVDYDLDMRLSKAGYSKAFAKDAIVHTERPASLSEYWRNELRWRRGHIHLLLKQRSFMSEGLFYGVTIVLFLLAFGTLLALFISKVLAIFLFALLLFSLLFFSLRRSMLVWQVAQFTGEKRYLRLFWIPAFFLLLSYLAAWVAIWTLQNNIAQFKGQRS